MDSSSRFFPPPSLSNLSVKRYAYYKRSRASVKGSIPGTLRVKNEERRVGSGGDGIFAPENLTL